MTSGRRIFFNTIASYGRSLIGVACGIFSTRWVLAALGTVDFGLYGLIGSLAIFMSFLSIQFSQAISRYYAFAVGQSQSSNDCAAALHECRIWFSVATIVHVVLPLILCSIGWPLGEYAIQHAWLSIPDERISACVWLWRFVCISCLISISTTPFCAMFTAKQEIVELTIYSLLQTLVRTGVIYYMFVNPSDWLLRYGFSMLLVTVIPQVVIAIRAVVRFPECRWVAGVWAELYRVKHLAVYAFWQAVGGIGFLAGRQIMSVILNKAYGPTYNASFGVAQTVSNESCTLTGSLQAAFAPAITTSCGAGDFEEMIRLSFRVCKIGTLLALLLAIPISLEIDEILSIWLKNIPPHASVMCLATMVFVVVEKLSCGHILAVNATGRIGQFQCLRGILLLMAIPLAIVPILLQYPLFITMMALPASMTMAVIGDVFLARRLAGLSSRIWVRSVLYPVVLIALITLFLGFVPQFFFSQSLGRLVFTTCVSTISIIFLSWFWALDEVERLMIRKKLFK